MKSKLSGLCRQCGRCCQYIVLPVKQPLQKAVMEEWLDARGCQVVAEDAETLYVKVDLPCPHLTKSDDGWVCDIYNSRPDGCREFDGTKFSFLNCKWKSLDHVIDESSAIEKGEKVHRRGDSRRTKEHNGRRYPKTGWRVA